MSRSSTGGPCIAYDEWNVWYRTEDGTLEERYSFTDALAVATYLNIFVRNCQWVAMANLAQMVNAIAPVVTTEKGAVVQPIYYPFLLHSEAALDVSIDVHVTSPDVEAPPTPPGDRWRHRIADLGPVCHYRRRRLVQYGLQQADAHGRKQGAGSAGPGRGATTPTPCSPARPGCGRSRAAATSPNGPLPMSKGST